MVSCHIAFIVGAARMRKHIQTVRIIYFATKSDIMHLLQGLLFCVNNNI